MLLGFRVRSRGYGGQYLVRCGYRDGRCCLGKQLFELSETAGPFLGIVAGLYGEAQAQDRIVQGRFARLREYGPGCFRLVIHRQQSRHSFPRGSWNALGRFHAQFGCALVVACSEHGVDGKQAQGCRRRRVLRHVGHKGLKLLDGLTGPVGPQQDVQPLGGQVREAGLVGLGLTEDGQFLVVRLCQSGQQLLRAHILCRVLGHLPEFLACLCLFAQTSEGLPQSQQQFGSCDASLVGQFAEVLDGLFLKAPASEEQPLFIQGEGFAGPAVFFEFRQRLECLFGSLLRVQRPDQFDAVGEVARLSDDGLPVGLNSVCPASHRAERCGTEKT